MNEHHIPVAITGADYEYEAESTGMGRTLNVSLRIGLPDNLQLNMSVESLETFLSYCINKGSETYDESDKSKQLRTLTSIE